MRFRYTFRTTASELWQLSMYYTYGSMVGVCNVIFTAAVAALMVSRWGSSGNGMRFLMVLGLCLFTVIQPLLVYGKARRQAAGISQDTTLGFDEECIHIQVGDQSSEIKWRAVRKISQKPTMIVIFSDTTHGFVITNRVLGPDRKDFCSYVASKVKPR